MDLRHLLPLLLLLLASGPAAGADPAVLWSARVQPLLDRHCVKCHGPIEKHGGLELDTPVAVLAGGDSGAVVVAGQPDSSPLSLNLAAGAEAHMPPDKQLSDDDREIVRAWIIALGDAPAAPAASPSGQTAETRAFATVTEAIDVLMAEAWARQGIEPAPPVDDAVWCRRVWLDLAGRIPTEAEQHDFLQAPSDTRRAALVDRLLDSDDHAVRMRELWDVFLMGRGKRESREERRRSSGWWSYLEQAFRTNRPWNTTVHEILVARPEGADAKGASWFLYERRNDHQAIAEAVAPLVYGARIDCAQCHDHPLAREIKQAHYWGLVAAFNRGKNVEGTTDVAESAVGGFVNFTNLKKESQPAIVTLLGGPTVAEDRPEDGQQEEDRDDRYVDPAAKPRVPKFSRREAFAAAATTGNPLLARAFVNRLWAVLLGRGIVAPVDEMTTRNTPSHPELLDWLAADFAAHDHDIRREVRGIVLSRVYALGIAADSALAPDPAAFSSAAERPLTAEQIARSWSIATGRPTENDGLRRAAVAAIPDVMPREYQATFQQAQFLSAAPALEELLKPVSESTVTRIAALPAPSERVEAAFRSVLGRAPQPEEAARAGEVLGGHPEQPVEAVRDLLWALVTSPEFLTMP
jgi:mono/diheme cytochrome c family protein